MSIRYKGIFASILGAVIITLFINGMSHDESLNSHELSKQYTSFDDMRELVFINASYIDRELFEQDGDYHITDSLAGYLSELDHLTNGIFSSETMSSHEVSTVDEVRDIVGLVEAELSKGLYDDRYYMSERIAEIM